MSQPVIGIVGLGPVGTILGGYLASAGAKVYGVERVRRAEQVNADGFRIAVYAELHQPIERCFTTLRELSQVEGLDTVFMCTKTWSIPKVMADFMQHRWPENLKIIAFMNGIGPEDAYAAYVGKERVCRGVVNYAGNLKPDGVVNMNWFHPPNLIGPATDRAPCCADGLVDLLNSVGLETGYVAHHEMKKAAFYKTVLNSALNALCAAHGLTMRQAMRLKHTRSKATKLLQEGLTVASTVGYTYGEDAMEDCMAYLEGGGDHYPSMWFDLSNKRPTEIEFINGKIVKIATMFCDVDVDLNRFFTSAIVTQEIKNGTRTEEDIPEYLVAPY